MSSIRVKCQCGTTVRSSKLREYVIGREPVPASDQFIIVDNQRVLKTKRGQTFPGLHVPRHLRCRACFKAANGKRRPTGRVRVRAAKVVKVKTTAPQKGKGKK